MEKNKDARKALALNEVVEYCGERANKTRLTPEGRIEIMEYLLQARFEHVEQLAMSGECNAFGVVCARLLTENKLQEYIEVLNDYKTR